MPGSAADSLPAVAPDEELVDRIRAGAMDVFGDLVERHQGMVFRILGRYERDTHLVHDLAQESFVKAWQALDRFDGRAPFEHWLARIATRVALDHLRRLRRRPEVLVEAGETSPEQSLENTDSADTAGAEAREFLALAMRRLSAEEQMVLTLMEIEERSVRETAQLTGWSSIVVRVRAHRARRKLAAVMTRMRTESHEA